MCNIIIKTVQVATPQQKIPSTEVIMRALPALLQIGAIMTPRKRTKRLEAKLTMKTKEQEPPRWQRKNIWKSID